MKLSQISAAVRGFFQSGESASSQAYHGGAGGGYGRSGAFGFNGMGSGAKYIGGLANSGRLIHLDHAQIRNNARKAYHDTPQARTIVDRYADVVVDTGIRVLPTPNAKMLGISEERAEEWAQDNGERFHQYMGSKKCHAAETMSGYQMQRLYQIQQQRDGDIFSRLYYRGDRPDLPSPLQFDFVDPSQLRGDAFTSTGGFNDDYHDGIKRDPFGREIAYKVWVKDPSKRHGFRSAIVPAVGESGRRHMLHGFAQEYPGQGRGYSRLGHILQELENLTDFSLATIKKAINQANITMFVEPSKDEDASNPFEDILTPGDQGLASSQFGSSPVPAETAVNVTEQSLHPVVDYCPLPEATAGVPGSVGIYSLTRGETIKAFPNSAPGDSFDSFVDSFFAYLSASMSIPVEVALMRFGTNYSASRGALIMFWRVAGIQRHEMDTDWIAPIYEGWMSEEIAIGRTQAPGWSDPVLRMAWLSHDLMASPIPNIDDLKSARANQMNAELNAVDLDRIAWETNGSDGRANRRKLAVQVPEMVQMPFKSKKGGASSG